MKPLIPFCLLLSLAGTGAFAATAETDPVGFNTVTCLPQSDTYCGVPFAQAASFQGVLAANPTVNGGQATLTPSGTTTWTANGFQTLYFVRMLSGTKAGMYYQITANTTGAVTVDLAGDNFTGVALGDSFRIHQFWTLGTLFPPATQTTVVASTSTLANGRRTEVLIPDLAGAGTNLAPASKFYIFGGEWKKAVSGNPSATNEILWPDAYFIVRHGHSSIVASTTFTPIGSVEMNAITTPLATRTAGLQDNFVTTGRPIPIQLMDLDLISSGAFVPSTGTLANQRRDTLLVFDNAVAQLNKAPSAVYYYHNGNWKKAVSGNPVSDTDQILPSHGLIIRKYQTVDGVTAYWTNSL